MPPRVRTAGQLTGGWEHLPSGTSPSPHRNLTVVPLTNQDSIDRSTRAEGVGMGMSMIARAERQCYQRLDEPVERALSFAFEASYQGRRILYDREAAG